MKRRTRETPYRIGLTSAASKAAWLRRAGALRYIGEHPDLQAVLMDRPGLSEEGELAIIRAARLDALVSWRSTVNRRTDLPNGLPCVFLDVTPDLPRANHCVEVNLDNETLIRTAFTFALRRGFRNIAYVGTVTPSERTLDRIRADAFRRAAARNKTDAPVFHPLDGTTNADASRTLAEWIAALDMPCAIISYNDFAASEVLYACREAHLSVPDQVSVIGIDNATEICENLLPQLTSLAPDFEYGGYLAAREAHRLLTRGRPRKPITLTYGVKELVERESTIDLRGGGLLVSRATAIIRQRYADPHMSVTDLVRRLKVSRQLLDLRFREILGHTVHAELERQRLTCARRLLRETGLTTETIARRCGYSAECTFRNAFKARFGITPGSVRTGPGA